MTTVYKKLRASIHLSPVYHRRLVSSITFCISGLVSHLVAGARPVLVAIGPNWPSPRVVNASRWLSVYALPREETQSQKSQAGERSASRRPGD